MRQKKLSFDWTSDVSTTLNRRPFPRQLSTYNFDADVISGRYLHLAESSEFLSNSWYDFESTDLSTSILTYPCDVVIPMSGYLANGLIPSGCPSLLLVIFITSLGKWPLVFGSSSSVIFHWRTILWLPFMQRYRDYMLSA